LLEGYRTKIKRRGKPKRRTSLDLRGRVSRATIARFAALGTRLIITRLDIRAPSLPSLFPRGNMPEIGRASFSFRTQSNLPEWPKLLERTSRRHALAANSDPDSGPFPPPSRRLRHHLCNYAHLYSRVWCTECITGRCTCDRLHVPAHRDSRDLVERCAARASIEARDRLAEKPRAFPRVAFKALAFGGTVLARGTLSLIRPASRSMWALRTPEGGGFLGFAFAGS